MKRPIGLYIRFNYFWTKEESYEHGDKMFKRLAKKELKKLKLI